MEEEIATDSSILAWKILWTGGLAAIIYRVTKSRTPLSDCTHMHGQIRKQPKCLLTDEWRKMGCVWSRL